MKAHSILGARAKTRGAHMPMHKCNIWFGAVRPHQYAWLFSWRQRKCRALCKLNEMLETRHKLAMEKIAKAIDLVEIYYQQKILVYQTLIRGKHCVVFLKACSHVNTDNAESFGSLKN